LSEDALAERLSRVGGEVLRPTPGMGKRTLSCPVPGSLASLKRRFAANLAPFQRDPRTGQQLLMQAPRPQFAPVAYEAVTARRLFVLRESTSSERFAPWSEVRCAELVQRARDGAAERLRRAGLSEDVERSWIGQATEAGPAAPGSARVRLVPLLSVGHDYADRAIRRILAEVPSACALRPDDVFWALSGLQLASSETGEVHGVCRLIAQRFALSGKSYAGGARSRRALR
jgi:CRISPR-associated protein Csb2